jgi:hypothetical protein
MAEMAIISSSDLTKYDRMDAGFHILRKKHGAETTRLEKSMDNSAAIALAVEMLAKVPLKYRRDINPLVRGSSNRPPDLQAQERAVREYPYLSLAIFGAIAGDVAEHYQAEARQADATAQLFTRLNGENRT